MERILSEEERQKINALLEKHQPRKEEKEKEMIVLSEKEKKISIKTEVASSSMKSFKGQPIEHAEEASKGKYEVIGMDIETEYEEMGTEEENEVKKLTEEELEMFQQYKEFYTIQGRAKGKIPGSRYICHVLPAVPQPGDLQFKNFGSMALMCL